jgi:hypothetical protein
MPRQTTYIPTWNSKRKGSKTWREKFARDLPWKWILECLVQPQLNCRQVVRKGHQTFSHIPRGEVHHPSLKQKKRRRERGPLANAKNLVQEQFGELTPETMMGLIISKTNQRGVESFLSEAGAASAPPVSCCKRTAASALPVLQAHCQWRCYNSGSTGKVSCLRPACTERNVFCIERYSHRRRPARRPTRGFKKRREGTQIFRRTQNSLSYCVNVRVLKSQLALNSIEVAFTPGTGKPPIFVKN